MVFPHHLRDPQGWAVEQERARHDAALYQFGEYAMFLLMWQATDQANGLVDRCPSCYLSYGLIAEAYKQSAKRNCSDCFGTTLEGGFKARLVRPSIWDFNEDSDRDVARGEVTVVTASIQTTSDFRIRNGDYMFRADGTRWQIQSVASNHLRTGFDTPNRLDTPLGYNSGQVMKEDEASVVYDIPPTNPADLAVMAQEGYRYPADFSSLEIVRGPLV